ncbi:MAG: hypothetical protein JWQ55_436 [Rhodopila sp.]|jgi:hypothetical protein|nr:hypothetical protein [Rhodopila sp.]
MLFRTVVALVGLTMNVATMHPAVAQEAAPAPAAAQFTEQPASAPAPVEINAPVGFGFG